MRSENLAKFTLYWIVKWSVAEYVAERTFVQARRAAFRLILPQRRTGVKVIRHIRI